MVIQLLFESDFVIFKSVTSGLEVPVKKSSMEHPGLALPT